MANFTEVVLVVFVLAQARIFRLVVMSDIPSVGGGRDDARSRSPRRVGRAASPVVPFAEAVPFGAAADTPPHRGSASRQTHGSGSRQVHDSEPRHTSTAGAWFCDASPRAVIIAIILS